MASIRGNLVRIFLRRAMRLNPAQTPHAVAKIRRLAAGGLNDWTPRGFIRSKEKTPEGVSFERIVKAGSEQTGRVVYYLHGGAYIAGLVSYYRALARDFNQAAKGCELILLDYHCAPEYQYPVQLTEALALWDDLVGRQGYRPENILVAGDSAGANLALALLLKLRDRGSAMPRAAFCISAWADMTGDGQSYWDNFGNDVLFGQHGKTLTPEVKRQLLQGEIYCFVGQADRTDPYVSPVYGEYHGFPPMFFTAGGHELLLSDTLTIVDKLKQSGVFVDCDIQPEMFHIYALFGKYFPESAKSYRRILAFVEAGFAQAPVRC